MCTDMHADYVVVLLLRWPAPCPGCRLTDSEICQNLLLVLLAGHDTSSTTLTRCMSNLQDSPGVMQKLREEQQAVVAKRGQQISTAALKDMAYADAVIR